MLLILIFSCKSKTYETRNQSLNPYISLTVDTLFKDKISIRAILVDKNKVWYAADKNRFGFYDLNTKNKSEQKITKDTLQLEFRS
ncbi:MAG: oxidoreductase, partial [Flavobacterium sp.]